jgi:long-chain fatty acid transport protein
MKKGIMVYIIRFNSQGDIMKKGLVLLCMLGLVLSSTALFAGSIDYLSNQSAEYLMTLNRNAGTDAADIVSYNPAGTVFLPKNGLYLNFSTQYLFKPYEQDFMGKTYKQDEPSIIPNLFAVYKKDAWAGFLSFNVTAGGGKLDWDKGDAKTAGLIMGTARGAAERGGGTGATTINSQSIEASSQYIGITPGVAYKINDKASVSLAARYIMADRDAKAKANFAVDAISNAIVPGNETSIAVNSDFDYDADGIGGIVGIDIKPINDLLFAIRYETPTHLDFKYDMNKRSATVTGPSDALNAALSAGLLQKLAALDKDGQKLRYDLPAILGLGLNYTVMPGLDVMSGFNYFFLKNATMEGEGDYNNGWELGLGSTYKVNPALKVGAGFLYTVSGETDKTPYSTENPHLDAWSFGLGGTYEVNNNFDVVLSGSRTQYNTDSNDEGTALEVRFKKVVYTIALGGQYRFDM